MTAGEEASMRRRARQQVAALKGFYIHLAAYLLVNAFLIGTRIVEPPFEYSILWVTAGWGVGVAAHGLAVFDRRISFLSRWEQRKVAELVEREKREGQDRG